MFRLHFMLTFNSRNGCIKVALAATIMLPIFITLDSGIFLSKNSLYNSNGLLRQLPLPLSVYVCYFSLFFLGKFSRAKLALMTTFVFFISMILSILVTTHAFQFVTKSKLLLLAQFLLPTIGLSLGMMYDKQNLDNFLIEKTMAFILAILMPIQLLCSWFQGQMFLTPNLYIFSIYQHLQYVPGVVASSFIFLLFSLWDFRNWRSLIILLLPIFGIYVAASGSMLAAGISLIGSFVFAVFLTLCKPYGFRLINWLAFALVLLGGFLYNFWAIWISKFNGISNKIGAGPAGMYTQKFTDSNSILPLNAKSRLTIWDYHLNGIFENTTTFIFGHNLSPNRNIWPSAHNYYLDIFYNFGLITLLVILFLVFFTLIRIYQVRKMIIKSSALVGLTFIVLFLIIPDNLLKVSLRQPYSGIFTYFLWGLLLSRIECLRKNESRSLYKE